MKIVVIGAGSVGAHVAYRLQEQGASVTLLDAADPCTGTSASSIAWLSQFPQRAWEEEPGKAALRVTTDELFKELALEVPGSYLSWSGTLLWGSEEERTEFTRLAKIAQARGVGVEIISGKTAMELEPALRIDPEETVFLEKDSGWVDAPAVVQALISAFSKLGGKTQFRSQVRGFDIQGESVKAVLTDDGSRIEADYVVNAAGSWSSHIAAMAGLAIPLDLVPGRIIYTEPFASGAGPSFIINTPTWAGRPDPSGGYAVHWRGHSQTENHGSNSAADSEMISSIKKTIPSVVGSLPARSSIGIRPVPPGGPIVGSVPWLSNLYFTVSHGGIGWGPTWGIMAAREILQQDVQPELAAMRPERFYLDDLKLGRHADDAEQV
ncbi:FAD-binding oxidoreductase [Brevibacterium sp. 91QC2O2]|uniref:NAD(P)/FAD-dependent oxidoreductase n=1 Tax=Brevibacterium sp. 91QC2O2 TaxID=2968458 RepID=UPI00211B8736|nr:FAD-dependent oxidoreductase [Brevibacterium sp. 91QC2O2]MCQ9368749.1 FAD-binding oxidoreductase [Brevibacterium sp. 91QC2O2]